MMLAVFDIEVLTPSGVKSVEIGNAPIIAIGFMDENGKSHTFHIAEVRNRLPSWLKDKISWKGDTIIQEGELLLEACDYIRTHDVNVLIGFNCLQFDIPYIMLRARKLTSDYGRYADNTWFYLAREVITTFSSCVIIDLLAEYLKVKSCYQTMSLDDVYRELFGHEPTRSLSRYEAYVTAPAKALIGDYSSLDVHLEEDLKITFAVFNEMIKHGLLTPRALNVLKILNIK